MKKYFLILFTLSALINAAGATISSQAVVTNLSAANDTSRVIMGTNSTLNFSFVEGAGNNYTNFTFPSGFAINEIIALDIATNQVSLAVAGKTNGMLNLTYTANSGGAVYFNFSGKDNLNISIPATAGTANISVMTNASRTANVNISLFVRNASQPYFLKANNTNFAVVSETFGQDTTTITLSGSGPANLTFNAPILSGEANITKGYGATNASLLKAVNASGNGGVIVYVLPDISVVDPIITLSKVNELKSSNLPAAVVAAGGVGVLIYAYIIRRRSR